VTGGKGGSLQTDAQCECRTMFNK